MKVLSLIVPAYNSAYFLDKGISSFLCPEVLNKLDIIIVDDGSTDRTAEIAGTYCRKFPESVRLIRQENKGHGGAVNTGCVAAVGKYLKVIDADDWILTENLPEFIRLLENCDSDVVLTHYHTVDISTGEIKNWKCYPSAFGRSYTMEEIMGRWKNFDRSFTFHGISYRTDFYHSFGIQLSEHVFYEDHEFATVPCCLARSMTPFDLFFYEYRIGDVRQSVSDDNRLKRIGHVQTVLHRLVAEEHRLATLSDAARDYFCRKTQGLLMSYLTTTLLAHPNKKMGRRLAGEMMAFFAVELPCTYEKTVTQYRILRLLNHLHVSKKSFDAVLHSRVYNKLRNNRDFD